MVKTKKVDVANIEPTELAKEVVKPFIITFNGVDYKFKKEPIKVPNVKEAYMSIKDIDGNLIGVRYKQGKLVEVNRL